MTTPTERRLELTRKALEREGLEALLIFGRGVVGEYGVVMSLAGFFPGHKGIYVLVAREGPSVVIAAGEGDRRWIAEAVGEGIEVIGPDGAGLEGYLGTVADRAKAVSPEGKLGLATGAGGIPAHHLRVLQDRLGYEPADADLLLTEARVGLDETDEQGMAEAARAAEAGLEAFAQAARVGMSEWEATAIIDKELRARGARTTLVHLVAQRFFGQMGSSRRFAEGDLVTTMAELVSVDGYWVEIGGLFSFGEPSPEAASIAASCISFLDRGRELLKPGARASDVADGLIRSIRDAGGEPVVGLGHGVGLDEAPPILAPSDEGIVKAGTSFSLHPSIEIGDRSVAVANTFLIGQDGARALSDFPTQLRTISS